MGMSRPQYAERHGVTPQAIDKAVKAGTVLLNRDGSVNLRLSDAIWGRRHAAWLGGADDAAPVRSGPVDLLAQLRLLAGDPL